ncbi:hypothetical protein LMG23992_04689 [Cupriavidus laharis]|uniref:DUF1145 domain-containing protein n=1 Tax=Cupriavidus laharis TaxID=151654 RepID=A0ABN7Z8C3_9BURK|nr:hypothetical protein [Cupriavidus laharis]CAG9182218.1 hypothetical protein LMG23992_04689 [Cupriavidus laharis]
MMRLMKLTCMLAYALALAATAGLVGRAFASMIQTTAVVLLVVHALEVVIAFRYVRLYDGSLFASIVLTLLFGFLHWWPLARTVRRPVV